MKDEEREELEFQGHRLGKIGDWYRPTWQYGDDKITAIAEFDGSGWLGRVELDAINSNADLAVFATAPTYPALCQKLTTALNELYSDLTELFPE